jgi:hypothetical protein
VPANTLPEEFLCAIKTADYSSVCTLLHAYLNRGITWWCAFLQIFFHALCDDNLVHLLVYFIHYPFTLACMQKFSQVTGNLDFGKQTIHSNAK